MSEFTKQITDRQEIIQYIMKRFGYSLEEATKNVEEHLGSEKEVDN